MTDKQKIKRYELENKEILTPAERLLLAALNDLREGDLTGKDLEVALEGVKAAEKNLEDEEKGKESPVKTVVEGIPGGESVKRVMSSQRE